jgi:DNA-binding HxlR family transcriptional regulator
MYQKKIPIELNCGLDLAKEVLSGKWKFHLLYFISEGIKRPSELQRKIPGATRRVLNVQLNELEGYGLVTKKVHAELPLKVEYSLTAFGNSIIPVITALGKWGDDHKDELRQMIDIVVARKLRVTSLEFLEPGVDVRREAAVPSAARSKTHQPHQHC